MYRDRNNILLKIIIPFSIFEVIIFHLYHRLLPHIGAYSLSIMTVSHALILFAGIIWIIFGLLLVIQNKNFLHYLISLFILICGVCASIISIKYIRVDYQDFYKDYETVLLEDCIFKYQYSHTYNRMLTMYGYSKGSMLSFDMTGLSEVEKNQIYEKGFPIILTIHPHTGYVSSYRICDSVEQYAYELPDFTLSETTLPKNFDEYTYSRRIMLAEDKKNKIKLYALHLDDKSILLITKDKKRILLDQNWYNTEFSLPQITMRDVDADGQEEILIVQHFTYDKTNTVYDELHILHCRKDGEWSTTSLNSKTIYDAMEKRLSLLYHPENKNVDLLDGENCLQTYHSPMQRDPAKLYLYPADTYYISPNYLILFVSPAIRTDNDKLLHTYAPVRYKLKYKPGSIEIQ